MLPAHTTVEPGRIIGPYEVLRLIGAGGMAEVHEARHVRLGRRVALKILKPHYASRPEAVRSFFEEARLVSSLNHANIVQVTDLIVEPGLACCVMELLEGKTLAALIEEEGPLDVPDALRIAHAVADALAAAHAAGVVHRDIKPDNIFLAHDRPGHSIVKLLDFGVAHLMDKAEGIGGASLSGQQAGTPAYMSPEQIQGQPVEPSSDIYSMGVVTYQMLTGKLPFVGNSFAEYVYKHAHEQPIPPHKAAEPPRTISKHCSDFVMRCLSKDPRRRLQDGSALREAIERTARTTGIQLAKGTSPSLVRTTPRFAHLVWLVFILIALGGAGLWAVGALFDTPSRKTARKPELEPVSNHQPNAAASKSDQPGQKPTKESPRLRSRARDSSSRPSPDGLVQQKARNFQIVSEPAGAEVFLVAPNRRPLGITPLKLTMPAGQTSWTLEIRAEDRLPATVTLNRETSSPLRVMLHSAPRGRGGPIQNKQVDSERSRLRSHKKRPRRRRHRTGGSHRHPDSIGTVNPFSSSGR